MANGILGDLCGSRQQLVPGDERQPQGRETAGASGRVGWYMER
jgi:hypothetical protein